MSNKDDLIGCGLGARKGWILRVTHNVISTGNTEIRRPGKRRFGLDDRRRLARIQSSDRRIAERRDT